MRPPEPVVLTGRHVRLEPLTDAHLPDLLDAAQDDAIWSWLSMPRPTVAEDLAVTAADRLAFVVIVKGRARGSTSYLDSDVPVAGLEIGWTWYARDLWATPVNPECKLLLLEHAFDELGAARVTLKADGRNLRSQGAIRKLGATYDGTLRHNRLRPDGSVRDTAYFSILLAEWPAVRAGLRARL